ncbi:MAG: hypothetical protein ACHQNT_04755 [Bacteroidia bacterium]
MVKNCSGLNYVLLKDIYDDITELPQEHQLEMLVDPDDYSALLHVISTGKDISTIKTKKSLHSQIISLHFTDHSSLILKIKISFERNGIVFMNAGEVLASATVNSENIKIPALPYLFEHIILLAILNKKDVNEKYREYFARLDFKSRSKIFAHIRPKYNLIIHLLDDLYIFNGKHYRNIKKTINTEQQNTGWRYAIHKIIFSFIFITHTLINFYEHLSSSNSQSVNNSMPPVELKDFLQRKAIA